MWLWTQVAEMKTDLPAFLTNPTSASTAWQMSQQKQSGCQLLFMALITRPMMNSPWAQNKRTRWKSRRLSGRLLFKSASVTAGGKKAVPALTTLVAAGSKEHLEVVFAVFPAFELSKEFRQGARYKNDARATRAFNQENKRFGVTGVVRGNIFISVLLN